MSNPGLHHNKIKTEQERSEDRESQILRAERQQKGSGRYVSARSLSIFSKAPLIRAIFSLARSIKSCGIP